jgi:hypothetical protein
MRFPVEGPGTIGGTIREQDGDVRFRLRVVPLTQGRIVKTFLNVDDLECCSHGNPLVAGAA